VVTERAIDYAPNRTGWQSYAKWANGFARGDFLGRRALPASLRFLRHEPSWFRARGWRPPPLSL